MTFFSQVDNLQNVSTNNVIKSPGKSNKPKNQNYDVSVSSLPPASVEVSSKGLEISAAQKAVEEIPDVRKDLVEGAKQKLASGTYFSDAVIDIIAEKMIYGWS